MESAVKKAESFRPSLKSMMLELEQVPGATVLKAEDYIVLIRGGYAIYIAIPNSKIPVKTYKQFWEERKHAAPKTPANLVFRYEVSSALRRADYL